MKTIDMDDVDPPDGGRRRMNYGMKPELKLPSVQSMIAIGAVALLVIGVLVMAATGNLGVISIGDDQVAVQVNYLTGSREVISTPGYKIYFPLVQEVFPLDRTPQRYLMEGRKTIGDNHVPFLTVRASDGSNFWFESLEIQYAILPSKAAEILDDSGTGDGFKRDWIRAYARSILRDEFGRFSAIEVADPSSYQAARIRSTERLNELLEPHGILVEQIITPKPRFDPEYEKAIEERKVADQDVDRLKAVEEQLMQEREEKLAKVGKEKEIEWQELQGDLVKDVKEAEREAIFVKKGADQYKVTREAEGRAELDRDTAVAEGLRAKYTKEAEGILARAVALERRGRVVVREALIEKLASIRFTLVPYNRDPSPRRIEHLNAGTDAQRIGGAAEGGQQ